MSWFRWALLLLLAAAAWKAVIAQSSCCSPKDATVFESFATVLDAQAIGLALPSSNVEFVVLQNHTYTVPSWLKLTPGAGGAQSGQAGSPVTGPSAILYGSPSYSDGNSSTTLQIVIVDGSTLASHRATLSIAVRAPPRYYTQFYRLLYPLHELSALFVSSLTASRLALELQGVYGVPMYVLELTRPSERGTIVRRSVTAPEGLYITMATTAGGPASFEVTSILKSQPCSSDVIANIVAAGNSSEYCFEELVDVSIAKSPVAGLSSSIGHEPYRPVPHDATRRNHRDSFVTATVVAAVCALLVSLLYISFLASRNKRVSHTTTDGTHSTQQGSRHRNIHGATVLLRHMSSAHQKFDNPIYDQDYSDTGAHFSNAAAFEEELEDGDGEPRGALGVMTVGTSTAGASAGPELRSARPKGHARRSEEAGGEGPYPLRAPPRQARTEAGNSLASRDRISPPESTARNYASASADTGPPMHPAPRFQRALLDQAQTWQRATSSGNRHNGQDAADRRGDVPPYHPPNVGVEPPRTATPTQPPPYRAPLVPGLAARTSSAPQQRLSSRRRPARVCPSVASTSGLSTATSQIDELIDEINELEDLTHT